MFQKETIPFKSSKSILKTGTSKDHRTNKKRWILSCFYLFSEDFIQHIFIIFFPLPILFQTFPTFPTHPTSCSLKNKQVNKHPKPWSPICVGQLSLSLPWGVVDILKVTPLKRTDFPSPSNYKLLIASWQKWNVWIMYSLLRRGC